MMTTTARMMDDLTMNKTGEKLYNVYEKIDNVVRKIGAYRSYALAVSVMRKDSTHRYISLPVDSSQTVGVIK